MNEKEKIDLKQRKNKYTVKFKLEVVYMIKKGISLHTIEKNYKIDRHTLRNWKYNEDQFKLVIKKENHYLKNRFFLYIENFSSTEEEDIYKFIKKARESHKPIDTKSVFAFASTLKEDYTKKISLN